MTQSIQPILPLNTTNTTATHPNFSPRLPLGAEVAIAVVAAVLICFTLITILVRRKRLKVKISNLEMLAKFPSAGNTGPGLNSEVTGNLEIDGEQWPAPELDGALKVEVDGGIAAHEVVDEATAVHEMP